MMGSPFLNVTALLELLSAPGGRVSARRQRSYFPTLTSQLTEPSLSSESNYSTRELSPDTWPDFERLFSKHGGVGGCWCMYYQRPRGGTMKELTLSERRAKTSVTRNRLLIKTDLMEFFSTMEEIQSDGALTD